MIQQQPRSTLLRWRLHAEGVLAFLLPITATTALSLPSGVLSPARLVTAAVIMLALTHASLLRSRGVVVGAVMLLPFPVLALVGRLRFPAATSTVDLLQLCLIVAGCLAFVVLAHQRRTVHALLLGWLAAGLAASVIGFWEITSGNHLPQNLPAKYYAKRMPEWNLISSFFDNPNLYAYMLVALLQLLLIGWAICRHDGRWPRLACDLSALVMGVLLLVQLRWTDGRAGALAVALTLLLLASREPWGRRTIGAGVGLGLILLAAGWSPLTSRWHTAVEVLAGRKWPGQSIYTRLQMWRAAWQMSRESGYVGVGPGGFGPRVGLPSNPYTTFGHRNPHWGMSEVLAELGLLGLVVLGAVLVAAAMCCLRTSVRLGRSGAPRWGTARLLPSVTAAMLLVVPVMSLANSTWLRQALTAVHLATLAALVVYSTRPQAAGPDSPEGSSTANETPIVSP